MSTHVTARHRAPVRSTPLSALSNAVTDPAGVFGRGGLVMAMSSGLVATLTVPAPAARRSPAPAETVAPAQSSAPAPPFAPAQSVAQPQSVAPATVPIAVQPAAVFPSGAAAARSEYYAGEPRTAPAAAHVTFENSAFEAVPQVVAPMLDTDGQSTVSAGLSRSFGSARGSSVIAVAARYLGVPYLYGGTGPGGWDCSGAVGYIFRQIGIHLGRTPHEQMLASTRIARSQARPGDLVFFLTAGRAYHVGIVAGQNMMYDAQRAGQQFAKRLIYTSAVVYGRVNG